jgi:hypothetical protein
MNSCWHSLREQEPPVQRDRRQRQLQPGADSMNLRFRPNSLQAKFSPDLTFHKNCIQNVHTKRYTKDDYGYT